MLSLRPAAPGSGLPVPRRAALVVWLVLTAVVTASCGGSAQSSVSPGYVTGPGVVTVVPPGDRHELPPVTGRLLGGGRFDSREHVGEVLVFNVWGSWCAPCRAEAPVLKALWEDNRDREVRFVGINIRDNEPAAQAFERNYEISYPSITTDDSDGALLALRSSLPPNAVPSTVIVDRKGRVAGRIVGETTYTKLSSLLDQVLSESV